MSQLLPKYFQFNFFCSVGVVTPITLPEYPHLVGKTRRTSVSAFSFVRWHMRGSCLTPGFRHFEGCYENIVKNFFMQNLTSNNICLKSFRIKLIFLEILRTIDFWESFSQPTGGRSSAENCADFQYLGRYPSNFGKKNLVLNVFPCPPFLTSNATVLFKARIRG